jgi:hypothetical protein
VYRSDLGCRLPEGLSLPHVHRVQDIDEGSAFFWLELVESTGDLRRHHQP